jgi:L-alanine-DL-glutamate epimerase-like enolase superfamily enzyme
MHIQNVQVDHFCIPLPVVLSDSTHGEMSHFGLITVRIDCPNGQQGMGYTYCVGDIGGITPWLTVARAAQARQLPVTTHGVQFDWESLSQHRASRV